MSKREFLQKLKEYLSYELPQRYVEKNIRYYDGYIDDEIKKGRDVSEVIAELGDPQLIAKTIVSAKKAGADGVPNTEDDMDFTEEIYGSSYNDSFQDSTGNADDSSDINSPFGGWHVYSTDGSGCLFFGILIFLIMFCIFSLLGAVIGAMSPVLAPVFMVILIMWLLGRRR